ncbi:undecaprenyl-diphosphate phosphatase, partial [Candidatus Peregrinibacteria bacterium]|nr:undecaprenyl-diphosphate phosphatase [Candidatus Peregrinibacteria bacterium]
MSLLQALLLGIIQGITEFLPISSSGHLVLTESLLNLEVDQLKDFDVIVHVGTLLAILIYFRREVLNTKYWPYLIIGTIPAVIAGL